jgi:hypothetical protein
MASVDDSTRFPTAFVVTTFAAAIAVGVIVAYLGIRGQIGWGVP